MRKTLDMERDCEYVGMGADAGEILKNMAFAAGGTALQMFSQTPAGQQIVSQAIKQGEESAVVATYNKVKDNVIANWKLYAGIGVGVVALTVVGIMTVLRRKS